jgi:maltose alpha-D-glucosyltransferase/alpha-amylase
MAGAPAAAALARVRRQAIHGLLCDAYADEAFLRALVAATVAGGETALGSRRLIFSSTTAFARLVPEAPASGVRLLPEGRDSGAIIDDRVLLKGYRRLSPGLNPEIEMGRFLTEVSPFPCILPLLGSVDYRDRYGESGSLAVLQGHVPNQGDLFACTLDLLGRLGEAYGERTAEWEADSANIAYGALVETLGRRTAELHLALTRPGGGAAFDPEPITPADLAAWEGRITDEAGWTLDRLGRHLDDLPDEARGSAETLLGRRADLCASIPELIPRGLDAVKTRCHGDLHLRRVLAVENDVVFTGFEGEPARPIAERRAKQCPLVDLAGLVWSFRDAARSTLESMSRDHPAERERLAEPLSRWRAGMVERLLSSYQIAAAGSPSFPDSERARDLVRLLILEKTLREIRGELVIHPSWVGPSIQGVLALLDGSA